jgi:hypothetical protein
MAAANPRAGYVTAQSGAVDARAPGPRQLGAALGKLAPPHAVDAALRAYRDEGRRLVAAERSVDLVERALRGGPYTDQIVLVRDT